MKKIVLLLCNVLITFTSFSQTLSQNQIKHLFVQKDLILPLQNRFYIPTNDITKEIISHPKQLVKNQKGLYCFINGTGQLFEITNKDSLYFQRIDTTLFWGYNNGCFAFTDNNNIYNLGGSGLWRVNGQLRKYNFINKEWDIVPLNREIPISFGQHEGLVWWNDNNRTLYTGFYIPANSAINSDDNYVPVNQCMALDLVSYQWNYLGDLSKSAKEIKTLNYVNIANTPMGLLICANLKFYLFNFEKNTIYESSDKQVKLQSLIQAPTQSIVYYNHGYFFKSNPISIDSISYSPSEWILIGPIYHKPLLYYVKNNKVILIAVGIILLLLLINYLLKKYKDQIISRYKTEMTDLNDHKKKVLPKFTETELDLIVLLLKNQQKNCKTTIDEINNCLGIQNRPLETRKAQRHKNISNINEAFLQIHQAPLIINEKMPEDRRSLLYFINTDFQRILEINEELNKRLNK